MSKKRLLLFTDGFPWDPGETPFLSQELSVLSEEFDIDIVAFVRKQFSDNDISIELPSNIRAYRYDIEDVGRKERLFYLLQIYTTKAYKYEKNELKKCKASSEQIKEAYTYLTRSLMFLKWLKSNVNILSYDICYTYWNSYAALAMTIYKESHRDVVLVTRTHGYDLYDERVATGRQCFKKYVDEKLNLVAFIADTGREYYLSHFATGDIDNKYIVSPIGVTKAENVPIKVDDKGFTLVSCSSVIPLKRVNLIVEALATIDDINICWIHFGGGSDFDSLRDLCVNRLEDKANIQYELVGQVSNEVVRVYYDNNYVDCFITSSSTEGSPVSIQEAMAYGIPVIGTNVGEIARLIEGNGILLDANPSVEDIASALSNICQTDENVVNDMREMSYDKWRKFYDAIGNATKFKQILLNLI